MLRRLRIRIAGGIILCSMGLASTTVQGQFSFLYEGPDMLIVDLSCMTILDWGHPETPQVFPTMPGQMITSWEIFSISGGYMAGGEVPPGNITVFYQAMDNFGNSALFGFNIFVTDTFPPEFDPATLPPDITVVCSDGSAMYDIGFSDNCDVIGAETVLTLTETGIADVCDGGVIHRTWTITDVFGNSATYMQTVTVLADTTPPEITGVPEDDSASCGEAMAAFAAWIETQRQNFTAVDDGCGVASTSDNAPDPSVLVGFCGALEVTFVATDSCGNTASTTATFYVTNDVAPEITTPAMDAMADCATEDPEPAFLTWLSAHGGAEAIDDCSQIQWSTDPPAPSLGDTCGAAITVTFIADDGCGNTATTTATFYVQDTTPPVISAEAQQRIVTCASVDYNEELGIWLAGNAQSEAEDICTGTSMLGVHYEINGVTLDSAGVAQALLDSIATGTCEDGVMIGGFVWNGVLALLPVDFVYTDLCGNSAATRGYFGIIDSDGPVFTTLPQDTLLTCGGGDLFSVFSDWYLSGGYAVGEDDCGNVFYTGNPTLEEAFTTLQAALDTGACLSGAFVSVTFAIHDFCGNTNPDSANATFGILDSIPPAIVALPEDVTFACDGNISDALATWLDELGGTMVDDPCGALIWTFRWQIDSIEYSGIPGSGPYPDIGSLDCHAALEVTFHASDICNNTILTSATFSFVDTTPPVIIVDSMVAIPCDSVHTLAPVHVSDDCTVQPIVYFSDVFDDEGLPGCYSGTITRTWYAEDDCGNVQTAVQIIETLDNESPQFIPPPDTIIYCVGDEFPDTGAPLHVTDNCDPDPLGTFSDEISGTPCHQVITRTWIVRDACLNESAATQVITLIDTIPPSLESVPEDLILQCGTISDINSAFAQWIETAGNVHITDNCGATGFFVAMPGSYDPGDPITWPGEALVMPEFVCGQDTLVSLAADVVYFDACGNHGITSMRLIIIDTIPPEISACTDTLIIILPPGECSGDVTLSPPLAFDACLAETELIETGAVLPIVSGMPGDSTTVIDPLIFDLETGVAPVHATGDVIITVTLLGVDADDPGEQFLVYAGPGHLLGITDTLAAACDTGATVFQVSADLFNLWAADGTFSLMLVPDTTGPESINDICPGAEVAVLLRFDQRISGGLSYAYRIGDDDRVELDFPEEITLTLDAGWHTFHWYVTDCAGHETSCATAILMMDGDAPEIICPDAIDVSLSTDEHCLETITVYRSESSDLCGVNHALTSITITGDTSLFMTFDGKDSLEIVLAAGIFEIIHSVTDISGNPASCIQQVMITDDVPPVALCRPGIAYVHPAGNILLEVDPMVIDNGSTDNCMIESRVVVPGIFPCDSAGTEQTVFLIVTDAFGNSDTCTAQLRIEVQPVEPSYSVGICANDTLQLFANAPDVPGNPYTFSWTGPNGFSSFQENPVIPGVGAQHSGTYVVTVTGLGGCTSMGTVDVQVDDINAPQLTAESGEVCEGSSVILNASTFSQDITYTWYRGTAPGGLLLGSGPGPTFSDTPPLPGVYAYYVVASNAHCTSNPSQHVMVEVFANPVATVLEPLVEVCVGGVISLGTNVQGTGVMYQWTGPAGFTSGSQFPEPIVDAQSVHAGTYALIVVVNGCTSQPATTEVLVAPRPEQPVIAGDSLYCVGGSLILTVNNVPDADQFIWRHPDGTMISTLGNSLMIGEIGPGVQGSWTVIALYDDCQSVESLPFSVFTEDVLPVEAANTGPVCEGSGDSVVLLVQIIPGVSYVWEGPGGFMSTEPAPTVPGLPGTYTVTATSSTGCIAESSTSVVTEPPPQITALSNSAGICANGTQVLTFAVTIFPPDAGAYTYLWTGPNNFTSTSASPQIAGLSEELNGVYTLAVSLGSCTSAVVTTEVDVMNAPEKPTIEGETSYCHGALIALNAPEYVADSVLYQWTTPLGNINIWNGPSLLIPGAGTQHSGSYSVIVKIGSCESLASDVVDISVAPAIQQPVVQAPAAVCHGDSIVLSTDIVTGANYSWTGPGGFTSTVRQPVIFPATAGASGAYQVQLQIGDCISELSLPVQVAVNPLPDPPVIETHIASVCLSDPMILSLCVSSIHPGAQYSWIHTTSGTQLGATQTACFDIADFTMFDQGIHSFAAFATVDGCTSGQSEALVIEMFESPGYMANAGSDASYCADDIVILGALQPPAGQGRWVSLTPGVEFGNSNDSNTMAENLSEGENVLVWVLDFESCLAYSSDTVVISIESTPQANRDSVVILFGRTTDIDVFANDVITGSVTARIIEEPSRGNALYRGAGTITYDPNLGFVGTDRLVYEVCSAFCPEQCTTAEVILIVGDQDDCFIPTIFTPNNDGINDRLVIPCLETDRFPQNRILIFNEWGDTVYEAQPYRNDWDGTRKGRDLPVATYFYIVDFGDGRPVQRGFLILER